MFQTNWDLLGRSCSIPVMRETRGPRDSDCKWETFHLLQMCALVVHSVWFFVTPWTVWPTRLLCPWDFQGKNTGVGCHFLLQGIFLTQGSSWPRNRTSISCMASRFFYCLSHQGNPTNVMNYYCRRPIIILL